MPKVKVEQKETKPTKTTKPTKQPKEVKPELSTLVTKEKLASK